LFRCGWQRKLCDPLVTYEPCLSTLNIKAGLLIKWYINLSLFTFFTYYDKATEFPMSVMYHQVSEDEGFVEAMPSSMTSSSQSLMVDEHHTDPDDVWTAAVHHRLDTHYTWEAVGRYDSRRQCI